MAGKVKTEFIGDTRSQDRAVAKVKADLARYQRDRLRDEQRLTALLDRQTEQRSRSEIRAIQRTQREIQRIRREELREAQAHSQKIADFRRVAAGIIVGGAAGAGYLATQAVQRTLDQVRAQRLLASSATEAGHSQAFLAEKNREFAASVGLSTTAAAETTAQIIRLATNTGDTSAENINKLLKAFADLGAARGIQGRDLETLIGTILSGQDEGLNRLGIADPGQLQRAYAESVGKTVEQLTQAEKVQAAVNAVLEKSAIFAGAAEARMNSLEGQVAKTAAAWENFTEALSGTFTRSGIITDFINEASRLLQGLQVDLEHVNRELNRGKSPRQIAQELTRDPSFSDIAQGSASAVPAAGLFFSDLVRGETVADAGRRFAYAIDPRYRRVDELTAQITAQQTSNQQQQQDATAQERDRASNQRLAKLKTDLEEITKRQTDAAKVAEEAAKKQADAEKKAADEMKRRLEEIRQARIRAFDISVSTQDNPFLSFLGSANARMRQLYETTKLLSPAIRSTLQGQLQTQNAQSLFGLRLTARTDAFDLREQADRFRGINQFPSYYTEQQIAQQRFDDRLRLFSNIPGAGANRDQIDRAIIDLARNLNPEDLQFDQRARVATAFEREAERRLTAEREATDFYQRMGQIISESGLKVTVDRGALIDVKVDNRVPDLATVLTSNPASVNGRYGN